MRFLDTKPIGCRVKCELLSLFFFGCNKYRFLYSAKSHIKASCRTSHELMMRETCHAYISKLCCSLSMYQWKLHHCVKSHFSCRMEHKERNLKYILLYYTPWGVYYFACWNVTNFEECFGALRFSQNADERSRFEKFQEFAGFFFVCSMVYWKSGMSFYKNSIFDSQYFTFLAAFKTKIWPLKRYKNENRWYF